MDRNENYPFLLNEEFDEEFDRRKNAAENPPPTLYDHAALARQFDEIEKSNARHARSNR
jgi:hypothetical protein